MASTGFPPGFRFHPTDVELIMYYLKRKVMGKKFIAEAISEINIYKYAPWDLPDKSALKNKDRKWFFFCPTERKYNRGGRVNRSTENGFWKTTGKDRSVLYEDRVVGMVKTLVFHKGHPPRGERTDWVFHEYILQDQQLGDAEVIQDAFVLCKLFHKNGPGPRIGAQYGAPFEEEEWDNESPTYFDLPSGDPSAPCVVIHPPEIPGSSVLTSMGGSEVSSLGLLPEPGPSSVRPIDEDITSLAHNDILHCLSSFTGDASASVQDGSSHEMLDNNNLGNNVGDVACLEMDDIFNGLPDLPNWQAMGDQASGSVAEIQPCADSFLQLGDLDTALNPVNNLEQMPTRNYNSYGDPQLCSSSELQPSADSCLDPDDLDIPLNFNNLEQMTIQNYNSYGDPQRCSSSGIQPFADSSPHLTDLETSLTSFNDLEQMPVQNYNFYGDQQFYYGDGCFSSTQYPVSSAQIPFLDAEFDGVGDVSNLSQAYYNGTTANDVDFMFSQPSEPTWINRFNNRG